MSRVRPDAVASVPLGSADRFADRRSSIRVLSTTGDDLDTLVAGASGLMRRIDGDAVVRARLVAR